ncbi:Hypothetical predicted protein [Lecanosticta acicola]|uniref:Heterokaryon incompatibility domain-containing protein n=1 Tax=Lecanosticta acicola TaxID=111012 RepID=A0AAI8Z874_9PEZI|nr:Hypothetical predicted protein [Lecanosticta acicola]
MVPRRKNDPTSPVTSPYTPLASSDDDHEFRLCNIASGSWDSPLELELRTSSLDLEIAYSCLSYVWGPPRPRLAVSLNGRPWYVRVSLFGALRQLRQRGQGLIWIDAVCIDQGNDAEKTEQVAMMGRIFAKATDVLIWLGDPEASDDFVDGDTKAGASMNDCETLTEAVSIIQKLADGSHFHDLPYFETCTASSCPGRLSRSERGWPCALKCLRACLDVEWFTRTWTVQEIVLARSATVLRGPISVPWQLIEQAWANWQGHLDTCCGECIFTLNMHDFQVIQRIAVEVNVLTLTRSQMSRGQALHRVLIKFRSKQATDPRDKIYGVLGLQSKDCVAELSPDYTRSLSDVQVSCAVEVMRSQGWPLPLFLELEQVLQGLPSWVPDWTLNTTEPPIFAAARLEYVDSYNCAQGVKGEIELLPNDILSFTAVRLGEIERVSRPRRLTNRMVDQLDLLDEWFEFVDLDSKNDKPYTESLREVVAKTMFAGRYYENGFVRHVTPADIEEWQAHLADLRRRMREQGPSASAGLHPGMLSQNIAAMRRRLCTTKQGYIGLCPERAIPGDEIYALYGGPAPMFLRHCGSSEDGEVTYHFALGHGYLHGLMDGEAVEMELPLTQVYIK